MDNNELRSEKLLASADPRYFAIDKYGGGLSMIISSYKKTLDFVIPSMPSMCLNISLQSHLSSKKIPKDRRFIQRPTNNEYLDNANTLFNYFELRIQSIIFAYTAIESWSNFIIKNEGSKSNFEFKLKKGKSEINLTDLNIIERQSLKLKIKKIIPEIMKSSSLPKPLHQKFIDLEKIRDRIIHLKTDDSIDCIYMEEKNRITLWTTLLNSSDTLFSDTAFEIMKFFTETSKLKSTKPNWLKKYPYQI